MHTDTKNHDAKFLTLVLNSIESKINKENEFIVMIIVNFENSYYMENTTRILRDFIHNELDVIFINNADSKLNMIQLNSNSNDYVYPINAHNLRSDQNCGMSYIYDKHKNILIKYNGLLDPFVIRSEIAKIRNIN